MASVTCFICDAPATGRCVGCKRPYCGSVCQHHDWKTLRHGVECKNPSTSMAAKFNPLLKAFQDSLTSSSSSSSQQQQQQQQQPIEETATALIAYARELAASFERDVPSAFETLRQQNDTDTEQQFVEAEQAFAEMTRSLHRLDSEIEANIAKLQSGPELSQHKLTEWIEQVYESAHVAQSQIMERATVKMDWIFETPDFFTYCPPDQVFEDPRFRADQEALIYLLTLSRRCVLKAAANVVADAALRDDDAIGPTVEEISARLGMWGTTTSRKRRNSTAPLPGGAAAPPPPPFPGPPPPPGVVGGGILDFNDVRDLWKDSSFASNLSFYSQLASDFIKNPTDGLLDETPIYVLWTTLRQTLQGLIVHGHPIESVGKGYVEIIGDWRGKRDRLERHANWALKTLDDPIFRRELYLAADDALVSLLALDNAIGQSAQVVFAQFGTFTLGALRDVAIHGLLNETLRSWSDTPIVGRWFTVPTRTLATSGMAMQPHINNPEIAEFVQYVATGLRVPSGQTGFVKFIGEQPWEFVNGKLKQMFTPSSVTALVNNSEFKKMFARLTKIDAETPLTVQELVQKLIDMSNNEGRIQPYVEAFKPDTGIPLWNSLLHLTGRHTLEWHRLFGKALMIGAVVAFQGNLSALLGVGWNVPTILAAVSALLLAQRSIFYMELVPRILGALFPSLFTELELDEVSNLSPNLDPVDIPRQTGQDPDDSPAKSKKNLIEVMARAPDEVWKLPIVYFRRKLAKLINKFGPEMSSHRWREASSRIAQVFVDPNWITKTRSLHSYTRAVGYQYPSLRTRVILAFCIEAALFSSLVSMSLFDAGKEAVDQLKTTLTIAGVVPMSPSQALLTSVIISGRPNFFLWSGIGLVAYSYMPKYVKKKRAEWWESTKNSIVELLKEYEKYEIAIVSIILGLALALSPEITGVVFDEVVNRFLTSPPLLSSRAATSPQQLLKLTKALEQMDRLHF